MLQIKDDDALKSSEIEYLKTKQNKMKKLYVNFNKKRKKHEKRKQQKYFKKD